MSDSAPELTITQLPGEGEPWFVVSDGEREMARMQSVPVLVDWIASHAQDEAAKAN